MEVHTGGRKYPKEWIMSFTNMDKFAHLAGDFVYLEVRINFKGLLGPALKGRKIVYAELEEPNRFFVSDPIFRRDEYEDYFYKILTICPFTAAWLNKQQGAERRIPVFYPIDPELGPSKMEKIYDIIYSGGLHSKEIFEDVKTISRFNYRFVAHNGILTYTVLPNFRIVRKIRHLFPNLKFMEAGARYITEKNIPHLEKWKIMAQTKITLLQNTVPCNASGVKNVWRTKGWEDNEAFALFPRPSAWRTITNFLDRIRGKTFMAPQLKTRAFEAALCRSLILCRRDPWNLIEHFFESDKEFVYYEPGKLEKKIREILSDFKKYEPIIENAHKKFMAEYTTQRYFEKYLKYLT
jgi:hypothetical protein